VQHLSQPSQQQQQRLLQHQHLQDSRHLARAQQKIQYYRNKYQREQQQLQELLQLAPDAAAFQDFSCGLGSLNRKPLPEGTDSSASSGYTTSSSCCSDDDSEASSDGDSIDLAVASKAKGLTLGSQRRRNSHRSGAAAAAAELVDAAFSSRSQEQQQERQEQRRERRVRRMAAKYDWGQLRWWHVQRAKVLMQRQMQLNRVLQLQCHAQRLAGLSHGAAGAAAAAEAAEGEAANTAQTRGDLGSVSLMVLQQQGQQQQQQPGGAVQAPNEWVVTVKHSADEA
jgi:hypothetical protein